MARDQRPGTRRTGRSAASAQGRCAGAAARRSRVATPSRPAPASAFAARARSASGSAARRARSTGRAARGALRRASASQNASRPASASCPGAKPPTKLASRSSRNSWAASITRAFASSRSLPGRAGFSSARDDRPEDVRAQRGSPRYRARAGRRSAQGWAVARRRRLVIARRRLASGGPCGSSRSP